MNKQLTEEMKTRICSVVSFGGTRLMAARVVDCHRSTIFRACRKDKAFAKALREAEENPELKFLEAIFNAGNSGKHWRAARWSLERMYPETYGNRAPNTITHEQLSEIIDRMISLISRAVPGKANREAVRLKLEAYARSLESGSTRKKLLRRKRHGQ